MYWIYNWLSKIQGPRFLQLLKLTANLKYYLYKQNQTYSGTLQAYSGMFKTLCNHSIFRTVAYSQPWYIQNAGIFKIRGIFRTLSNIHDEVFCENSQRL